MRWRLDGAMITSTCCHRVHTQASPGGLALGLSRVFPLNVKSDTQKCPQRPAGIFARAEFYSFHVVMPENRKVENYRLNVCVYHKH